MSGVSLTSFSSERHGARSALLLESQDAAVFLDFGREMCGSHDAPHLDAFRGQRPQPLVLLSHAHDDHAGDLHLLPRGARVVAAPETAAILGPKAGHLGWRRPEFAGDVHVEAYPVDHSVPGSLAFIVELGGQRIAYTGDLRFHGSDSALSEAFVQALAARPVDVLICEGTHVGHAHEDDCRSESEVFFRLSEAMQACADALFVQVSPMHLSRLELVWAGAVLSRRRLIVGEAHSSLLAALAANDAPYRTIIEGTYTAGAEDDSAWRRLGGQMLAGSIADTLSQDAGRYAVCLSRTAHTLEALSAQPVRPSVAFVHSAGRPQTAFGRAQEARRDAALRALGATVDAPAHTSGHAHADDIRRLVQAANAGTVVPVHTRNPDAFRQWHDRVMTPAGPAAITL